MRTSRSLDEADTEVPKTALARMSDWRVERFLKTQFSILGDYKGTAKLDMYRSSFWFLTLAPRREDRMTRQGQVAFCTIVASRGVGLQTLWGEEDLGKDSGDVRGS